VILGLEMGISKPKITVCCTAEPVASEPERADEPETGGGENGRRGGNWQEGRV
jgi:hypothetical protein